MKELTTRQSLMLVFLSATASKFFMLPSNLLSKGGHDSVYLMFIFFIIEVLIIMTVVRIATKFPNKTINQLMVETFGNFYAGFINISFFVFFMLKSILNFSETYSFFLGTLYDEISPFVYAVPLFLVAYMAISQGLRTIGRTTELLFFPIIFGLSVSMIIGVSSIDFSNLLPVFADGLSTPFEQVQKNMLWFGDFFVFLFFFKNVKFDKTYCKKIFFTFLSAVLVIISFFLIFHCLYPYSAEFHRYAISEMTQSTPNLTNLGRIDWLTIMIWTIASIIQTIIFMYCALESFINFTHIKNRRLSAFITIIILGASIFIFNANVQEVSLIFQSTLRWIFVYLLIGSFTLLPLNVYFYKKKVRKK